MDVGIDEFGREHFVVETAPGRLGMSLGENELGHVIIRSIDTLTVSDLAAWSDCDRLRVQVMREAVHVGDRIVAIEGQDIVHCSLHDVIIRLSKLSSMKRRLTLARYHENPFPIKKYDVEKLVYTRMPSGPLGLRINESIHFGAFVEGFQPFADGSLSKLSKNPLIHRGCQFITINNRDVSTASREEVIALLLELKDQEKEVIFYRATASGCNTIFSIESSAGSERNLGFTINEKETMKCVVTSISQWGPAHIQPGDVLIGVNSIDVTSMKHKDAIELVKETPLPRHLFFARYDKESIPECYQICIESGPLGLNLDPKDQYHARVSGFTNPVDANRTALKSCAEFLPGSYILAISGIDVSSQNLATISTMLGKMKQSSKDILFGNEALLKLYDKEPTYVKVQVPKGPLGIHFDGAHKECAIISGFYKVNGDEIGPIEQHGGVRVGAKLTRINGLNVSCLSLSEITNLLKKLVDLSKSLEFYVNNMAPDEMPRFIEVRVPSGPLGIDLKTSLSNRVIVDKLNRDPSRGSTRLFDHGGVIEGSEILAIDGIDISSLDLSQVLRILTMLACQEKVLTFSTTKTAYGRMLTNAHTSITVGPSIGITFNSRIPQRAIVSSHTPSATTDEQMIPVGSCLIAIDRIDVRAATLELIMPQLQELQHGPTLLTFDTTSTRETLATLSLMGSVGINGNQDSMRSSHSLNTLNNHPSLTIASMRMSVSANDLTISKTSGSPLSTPLMIATTHKDSTSEIMSRTNENDVSSSNRVSY